MPSKVLSKLVRSAVVRNPPQNHRFFVSSPLLSSQLTLIPALSFSLSSPRLSPRDVAQSRHHGNEPPHWVSLNMVECGSSELTPGSQRFNLISKSDIRYVGTLHEINPEASTIALENVMSFGSEGRRGNPASEVPPSTSVYEYIVFRGSDVKDISIASEEQKEAPQPEAPRVPDDPAILGVSDFDTLERRCHSITLKSPGHRGLIK
ncbi:unnamed protein product [Penicillium olsonii]|uniref:Lsm14-like N-terminal domain-containing protein n=1 Tax=Penicillium olsonii TaxID=99116 RepID=A0A9W4HQK3_PENOL|nr:unnamed protein product [Penicillium olsonii]CAG8092190.1 unnamed protein product [Penicillium olsonii]